MTTKSTQAYAQCALSTTVGQAGQYNCVHIVLEPYTSTVQSTV